VWIKNMFNNRISKSNSILDTLCDGQQAARVFIISRKVVILNLKSSDMLGYIPSPLSRIAGIADL
jgi:hypothetical protein